jgi:hypothetical protein
MPDSPVLIALHVLWVACTSLAFHVANQKNRSSVEALFLSLIFGPFGVLVLVLLPTLQPGELEARRKPKIDPVLEASKSTGAAEMDERIEDMTLIEERPTADRPRVDCPACFLRFSTPMSTLCKTTKCPGCGSRVPVLPSS